MIGLFAPAYDFARPARRRLGLARAMLAGTPTLAWTGIALLLSTIPTLMLALLDDQLLNGTSVWLKPWKFQFSTGVYLLTLALVFVWLPAGPRASTARRYVVWAAICSALFEVGYISWRAALGEASHFNLSTPFAALMYQLMGLGALTLTSTALVQGVMVLRSPGFGLRPELRQGIGWGLLLTFFLGSGFGAYMAAQPVGHWVGGTLSDGAGLAVVKWSRDGGDLRVAHFFGVHAVHFIALFAWGLGHFADRARPQRSGRRDLRPWVWAFCVVYAAFCGWTFVQALRGQPFLA